MSSTRILTIMRGVSGSGKTTRANELKTEGAEIVSADDYWGPDYEFDKSKIADAHIDCMYRCERLMKEDVPHIIVDNTNCAWVHMLPYFIMAQKYGYAPALVMPGNLEDLEKYVARNIHGVPEKTVRGQAEAFEKWSHVFSGQAMAAAGELIKGILADGYNRDPRDGTLKKLAEALTMLEVAESEVKAIEAGPHP